MTDDEVDAGRAGESVGPDLLGSQIKSAKLYAHADSWHILLVGVLRVIS